MRGLAVAVLACAACVWAAPNKPVRTESGLVVGVPARQKSITVFRGIPFAAPPVAARRWRAPDPPLRWSGVRVADRFGANCMQTIVEGKKPWTHEFMAHGEVSEDCLFLNIWAPAGAEKHPVLVYLHGGANTEGSGSIDAYNGEGLAQKGVVIVTVNYRLGIFGFFTHAELSKESGHGSGNYALLDQIAALKWVRANIAAFGGDPKRVTVVGQSAGAFDIACLIASPLARDLFQRAIMESGGVIGGGGIRPLAASEEDGAKFAAEKNAHSLAELRALSSKEVFTNAPRFGPVNDGFVIAGSAKEIFGPGKKNDVPTLAGSNADENGASPQSKTNLAQFKAQAQSYGDLAAEFLKDYPAATDDQARASANDAARDRARVAYAEWAVARAENSKTPAYLYFWNHVLPGPDSALYGAFHTSEVPYVFNTLDSDRPFTPEDHRIGELVSSYWANFAATGDPNGKGLPPWPQAARQQPVMVMRLGDQPGAIPAAGSDAKLALLRRILSSPARSN